MAKYKLIKKFPGSASLGTVVDINDCAFGITHNYTDYPEFWEKVEEKEYEIIKETYNTLIGKWEIRSIKRLNDGEIFSVGDLITYNKKHGFGEWRLNNFSLENNEILANCTRISSFDTYPAKVSEPVTNLKKLIKKPILITEDGKEINEGDQYFIGAIYIPGKEPIPKYFSTKALRDKYIEENKPMYSKKDMLEFITFGLHKKGYKPCLSILALFEKWLKEKGN